MSETGNRVLYEEVDLGFQINRKRDLRFLFALFFFLVPEILHLYLRKVNRESFTYFRHGRRHCKQYILIS